MTFLQDEPDISFDDMLNTWINLADVEREVARVEYELERTRAAYRREAVEQHKKSMTYADKVVTILGNNLEQEETIRNLVYGLTDLRRALTKAKGTLDVMHERNRAWQTKSANLRRMVE